ncbi:O-antigen ligase family protein [Shewanella olleyana]|uniref:O-antigen ligase family protein n=1 Tax=Shewanella olleyana TaxID=135626 RepID=UPI00200BE1FA|nr:O-antigen ligase family protein [Shewanella olleyana]MCL1067037.1 O-antigen ligase family protein [Shewanella olleyana]
MIKQFIFSLIIAGFISSGLIKASLSWFTNFDFTVVFALAVVSIILLSLISKKIRISGKQFLMIFILLLFYMYLSISVIFSLSEDYSYRKLLASFSHVFVILFPIIILVRVKHTLFFISCFAVLSGIVSVYFRMNVSYGNIPESILGLYLNSGLFIGMVFLLTFYENFTGKLFFRIVTLILLIMLGARGPLIFCIMTLFIFQFKELYPITKVRFKIDKKKIIYTVLSFILIPFFVFFILQNFDVTNALLQVDRTVDRLLRFLNDDMGNSITARADYFNIALEMFFEKPMLGHGFGSFSIYVTGVDGRLYPHNIILELLAETGLIGLILFISFITIFITSANQKISFYVILVFFTLNLMKSYSYEDLRAFLGVLAILAYGIRDKARNVD